MYFEQLVLTNVPAPWSAGADGAPPMLSPVSTSISEKFAKLLIFTREMRTRRHSHVANRVAQ